MAATRGRTLNVKPNPAPDASGWSRALHDQGEEPWIRAGRTSGRSSAPPAVGRRRRPATGRRLHRRQEPDLPLPEDRAERGSDSGACRTAAPRRPGAHAGLRVDDDLRAESERQRAGDPRLPPTTATVGGSRFANRRQTNRRQTVSCTRERETPRRIGYRVSSDLPALALSPLACASVRECPLN